MKVLLIGSGGREHALAWKISASPLLTKLYCAPGNPGIAQFAELVDLDTDNHQTVIDFTLSHQIDLVVVGPEAPLVAGITDILKKAGIRVFGPSKAAAQLEGSKGFTKDLCARYNIPTGAYGRFNNAPKAKAYTRAQSLPIVIKADGLAAGKGVVIATTAEEAADAIDACFEGAFGQAGSEVVVEEFLHGEEASFFCLSDGKTALAFGSAQDHKRVGDGDTGPNTGGMGAYSPAPIMDEAMTQRVMQELIEPTLKGMNEIAAPFSGVLFLGLMINEKGPQLIEYNTRFGDPECQVLLSRLKSDVLPILVACADGKLDQCTVEFSDDTALTVVMAAEGYPASPKKGTVIKNLANAESKPDVKIFHAGTALKDGDLIANGGRVLNITATGQNVTEAHDKAYQALKAIDWPEGFYRSDIGWRAIALEKSNL